MRITNKPAFVFLVIRTATYHARKHTSRPASRARARCMVKDIEKQKKKISVPTANK
jgi:hypothetical protein